MHGVEENLQEITVASGQIEQEANAVSQRQLELASGIEQASRVSGRFDTGGVISRLHGRAQTLAQELGVIFEQAIGSGRVTLEQVLEFSYEEAKGPLIQRFARLFDVSRADPAGFQPPKYHTAYDAIVDLEMMERMDAVLAAEPGLVSATPLDLNGYAPAFHRVYTNAITGDSQKDLVGNRAKRFFLDSPPLARAVRMELGVELPRRVLTRAEFRRAGANLAKPSENAHPFLIQSYARDTGEVVTLLSVPLYVSGQRFGIVGLFWDPESLRK